MYAAVGHPTWQEISIAEQHTAAWQMNAGSATLLAYLVAVAEQRPVFRQMSCK